MLVLQPDLLSWRVRLDLGISACMSLERTLPTGLISTLRRPLAAPGFVKLFKNAGKLQLNRVISAVISAAQIAVVARYLSPHDYGIYGLVYSTVVVIQSVFDVRCGELVLRFFFQYQAREERRKAGAILLAGGFFELAVCALGALVLTACAHFFAGLLLNDPGGAFLFMTAALMPLSNIGSGLAASILSIDRAYGRLALADSLSNMAGFFVLLVALWWHASVATLLGVSLFTQLAKGVLRWRYLIQSDSGVKTMLHEAWLDRSCLLELKSDARAIVKFALANNVLAFLKILQGSLPNFLLGVMRTPAEVGFYYLGQRVGTRLSSLCAPVTEVAFREAAEDRTAVDPRKKIRGLKHGVLLIAVVVVPVLVGVVLLGHWTIPLVFGLQYAEGILPVQVTVGTYALALLFNPLGSLLMVEGKTGWINAGFAAGLLVQLLVLKVCVPLWAATGAAVALAAFYCVANIVMACGAKFTVGAKGAIVA